MHVKKKISLDHANRNVRRIEIYHDEIDLSRQSFSRNITLLCALVSRDANSSNVTRDEVSRIHLYLPGINQSNI